MARIAIVIAVIAILSIAIIVGIMEIIKTELFQPNDTTL